MVLAVGLGTRDFDILALLTLLYIGNVNLRFRQGDNHRQKMNLNLVDQNHIKRDVVNAEFASYLTHSFVAQLGLVC